jgi:hypothetical protein
VDIYMSAYRREHMFCGLPLPAQPVDATQALNLSAAAIPVNPRSSQRPPYDVHVKAGCGSEGMAWIDFLGFSAAFSVLASFCMTTIVALRTLALLSNVLFILYGLCAHIYPVLVLHIILLPINLVKLHRIKPNLTHAIR